MYKIISRIYPAQVRERIKTLLKYSDLKVDSNNFIGFAILSSFLLAVFSSFMVYGFTKLHQKYVYLIVIGFFVIFQIFFYFAVLFRAEGKARFIESVLPDALQLTSSNLKAGFTVERAFILSARPEFGPFSDELSMLGREITTGKDIKEAMLEMTERIKSEKLKKTVELIAFSIESGGELATLLSQTAQNLRNQMLIEERTRASVLMYFIFILSAVAFASPVLFALSSFLATIMTKQLSAVEAPPGIAMPIVISKIPLTQNFILGFIVITLTTLSIFGSLALGLIKKGEAKEGIKYIPFILISTLGIFFSIRAVLSRFFSGFL
jgi:pilus assembly protein TadC